jgi:type II secretory pathway component GspD/PulD (secretin)
VQGAQALIRAAEQAAADYERQIEERIARHRAEQIAAAEAQSRELVAAALERNERYAARLRERLGELIVQRDRLVATLREEIDAAAEHVHRAETTRAELYRVIGALGSLEGSDDETGGERAHNGNGTGAADRPGPIGTPDRSAY